MTKEKSPRNPRREVRPPMTEAMKEKMREYYQRQLRYLDSPKSTVNTGVSEKQQLSFTARQRVWRHNSFIGHSVMMRGQLNAMLASDTVTSETRQYARTILGLLPKLQNSLTSRVDQDPVSGKLVRSNLPSNEPETSEASTSSSYVHHQWITSPLGHGETMCSVCKITNREAAALGQH